MRSLFQDPLDEEKFDSIQYINQQFPTETSLDDLNSFISNIGLQISTLDDEISKAVQTQSVIGKQASKDIIETQESINDLFQKIHDIKSKASQSEKMVQEICADIKKLDYAKNHLQTSITSLNRLQMLINAVTQLETLADEHSYREAANLLDAVKQFMTHFDKYLHITVIKNIKERVEIIRTGLASHISIIFKQLANVVDSVADADIAMSDLGLPGGLRAVAESCLVVDSLGTSTRKTLLEEFVQMQLVTYENLFGVGKQHFALDQVDRRWSWFKRLLKYIDSKFGTIFPNHWRIPLRLCLEFTERTKIHLVLMLTEIEDNDTNDVHLLLKALQSALRFEQEMSDRFNLLYELQQSQESEAAQNKLIEEEEAKMQLKLKSDDKLMYVPTDHNAINREDETECGFLSLANNAISGGISGVFDKFLGSYVVLERQNLEDMLLRLSQEEDTTSEGVSMSSSSNTNYGNVYGSSTGMFVFIKNSIKRCTALTKGQTFLLLCKEFQNCMIQYVIMLRNRCPTVSGSNSSTSSSMSTMSLTGGGSSSSSNTSYYKLPPGTEVCMCYLINTGEYCAEVVPTLEQMIQQKIQPNLISKVNFETEVDAFMDLVAYCIKVLVSGIMDRLEPAFRTMQATNWGSSTQVGEESQYLHVCNKVLLDAIPKIRSTLSPSYFNNLCTKIATEILSKYLDVILKQKSISEVATQQLLLDTYNLKTGIKTTNLQFINDYYDQINFILSILCNHLYIVLVQMPQFQDPTDPNAVASPKPSSMYLKLINTKIAHIEMILKLLGTPEDMLLERFRIMWPDGQSSDLQLLMSLKGTKRNDQQVILEMLGLSAASKMLNKAHTSDTNNISTTTQEQHSLTGNQNISEQSSTYSAASAAAASAAALASTSMKNLTLDISSSARNLQRSWSQSANKY